MAKTNKPKDDEKTFLTFYESEKSKFGLKADATPRDFTNAVRKKLGLTEIITHRSSKRRELKEKLGLPADATQKEINEAILKKLEE